MDVSLFLPEIQLEAWMFLTPWIIAWGGILLFSLVKVIMKFLSSKWGKHHGLKTEFLELFAGISWYSAIVIPLFMASFFLPLKREVDIFIAILFAFAVMIELGRVPKFVLKLIMEKGFKDQDAKTKKNLTEILNTLLQVVVWILAALVFFDTVGIAITPLLASLWVWGIAIAFASQKLIEDFFSSFSIMSSSPFRIGDIITMSGFTGTVKKIWLRTTSLETIEGKTIIIPNRLLVSEIVENSGTIKERRKRFSLFLVHQTPIEKITQLLAYIEKSISSREEVKFEWAFLKDLNQTSLEILVSYVLKNDDRLQAVEIHDQILRELLLFLEQEKIELAYPTQTIHLKK